VRACFAAQPDLTLRDLQARLLAERGVKVGYGAVWDFVHSEGLIPTARIFDSLGDSQDGLNVIL
jgi:transposase